MVSRAMPVVAHFGYRHTIPDVSARARWTIVAVGVVATFLVANRPTGVRMPHGAGAWVVQPGETLTLSPEEVHPGAYPADEYICPGKGRVVGTPEPGQTFVNGRLVVETLAGGSVTAGCSDTPGFGPPSS